jgi:hypothetical protein
MTVRLKDSWRIRDQGVVMLTLSGSLFMSSSKLHNLGVLNTLLYHEDLSMGVKVLSKRRFSILADLQICCWTRTHACLARYASMLVIMLRAAKRIPFNLTSAFAVSFSSLCFIVCHS